MSEHSNGSICAPDDLQYFSSGHADQDYLTFVANLANPQEGKAATAEHTSSCAYNKHCQTIPTHSLKLLAKSKTTPLLEWLRRQKQLTAEKRTPQPKSHETEAATPSAPAAAVATVKGIETETRAGRRAKQARKDAAAAALKKEPTPVVNAIKDTGKSGGKHAKLAQASEPRGDATGPAQGFQRQQAEKAPKQKLSAKAQGIQVSKKEDDPAQLTILAPPRQDAVSGSMPSTSKRLAPLQTSNAESPDVQSPASSAQARGPAPDVKPPKAKFSNFEDIVGQFAKQMTQRPGPGASVDKVAKPAQKDNSTAPISVTSETISPRADRQTLPTPVLMATSLSPERGRGGSLGNRGGKRGQPTLGTAIRGRATQTLGQPSLSASETTNPESQSGDQNLHRNSANRGARGRGGASVNRGAQGGSFRGGRGGSRAVSQQQAAPSAPSPLPPGPS